MLRWQSVAGLKGGGAAGNNGMKVTIHKLMKVNRGLMPPGKELGIQRDRKK